MYVYMYLCMYICTYVCAYVCVHVDVNICVCVSVYVYVCMYELMCVHAYFLVYSMCIKHTHTCTCYTQLHKDVHTTHVYKLYIIWLPQECIN